MNKKFYFLMWIFILSAPSRGEPISVDKSIKLNFNVTGAIAPAPIWDGSQDLVSAKDDYEPRFEVFSNNPNKQVDMISLDFTSVASDVGAETVMSATTTFMFKNAKVYPAALKFVMPAKCSIGASNVADVNVHLKLNGKLILLSGIVVIPSSGPNQVSLEFHAAGKYGQLSGAVSCASSGYLEYRY